MHSAAAWGMAAWFGDGGRRWEHSAASLTVGLSKLRTTGMNASEWHWYANVIVVASVKSERTGSSFSPARGSCARTNDFYKGRVVVCAHR